MIRRPPRSPPFPYTTLSRSLAGDELHDVGVIGVQDDHFRCPARLAAGLDDAGKRVVPLHERHRAAGRTATRQELLRRADRKSTRLNSSHLVISYAVFCLKKK